MSKSSAIEIFLRVRPTKAKYKGLNVKEDEQKCQFFIPKDRLQGYVNNTQENFDFTFNQVLDMPSKQDRVFNEVAKDVCDSAIEGYNGTIFAYGQTGSGKTFTMTGGPEKYSDRGIIPRTVSYLFTETAKREDTIFEMSISYLEIYGGSGYDLLDAEHTSKKLEDLPPVIPRETENEEIILSGLSIHKAQSEDVALKLLLIGDTNRVVCETPKNDASTRSHCIFIIMIESRKVNSDVKTVSRIHLVDLSGSERIEKTGVKGKLQEEARAINLSLHYLEHVIVCLQQRAQGENIHVPYRNSLMTLVLRDSLGGNCKTKMVATISGEEGDIDESISTCKFAMRCAMIKNYVLKNESVDPAVIIERLKRENAQLKAELAMLKGGSNKDHLEPEEIEDCRKKVKEFIDSKDPSQTIILNDRLMINECFFYFKHMYNDQIKSGGKGNPLEVKQYEEKVQQMEVKDVGNCDQHDEEIARLKLLIQQRDNEILILLNLVNKNKQIPNSQQFVLNNQSTDQSGNEMLKSVMRESKPIVFPSEEAILKEKMKQESITSNPLSNTESTKTRIPSDLSQISFNQQQQQQNKRSDSEFASKTTKIQEQTSSSNTKMHFLSEDMSSNSENLPKEVKQETQQKELYSQIENVNKMLMNPLNLTNDQLMDRAKCFELFRKSYRKNEAMSENKELLKSKYDEAKIMGTTLNSARGRIQQLKNQLEELRKQQAIKGLVDGKIEQNCPEEEQLIKEIDKQKRIYYESLDKLKQMKSEIENIQKFIENNQVKLQKDFDNWIAVMMEQRKQLSTQSISLQQQIPLQQQSLNNMQSQISNASQDLSKIKDKQVEKKLQEYYKMRDEIYKN